MNLLRESVINQIRDYLLANGFTHYQGLDFYYQPKCPKAYFTPHGLFACQVRCSVASVDRTLLTNYRVIQVIPRDANTVTIELSSPPIFAIGGELEEGVSAHDLLNPEQFVEQIVKFINEEAIA